MNTGHSPACRDAGRGRCLEVSGFHLTPARRAARRCGPIWLVVLAASAALSFGQEAGKDPGAEVRDRLKSWTTQLESLKQGVPTPDVTSRIGLLEVAIDAAQRHLQAIELRKSGEARLKVVEKQTSEWSGPPGEPPHSWVLADRYRATWISAEEAIAVAMGFQKLLEYCIFV